MFCRKAMLPFGSHQHPVRVGHLWRDKWTALSGPLSPLIPSPAPRGALDDATRTCLFCFIQRGLSVSAHTVAKTQRRSEFRLTSRTGDNDAEESARLNCCTRGASRGGAAWSAPPPPPSPSSEEEEDEDPPDEVWGGGGHPPGEASRADMSLPPLGARSSGGRLPGGHAVRTPNTQHPTPSTLHPSPYTQHPTPNTLHPPPYTLHPTPNTQHPTCRAATTQGEARPRCPPLRSAPNRTHRSKATCFRVSGFGFRVSGFGFWFRVPDFGFQVSGVGCRVRGSGFRAPGFWFLVSVSIWG